VPLPFTYGVRSIVTTASSAGAVVVFRSARFRIARRASAPPSQIAYAATCELVLLLLGEEAGMSRSASRELPEEPTASVMSR
jgi:hypothetical protein